MAAILGAGVVSRLRGRLLDGRGILGAGVVSRLRGRLLDGRGILGAGVVRRLRGRADHRHEAQQKPDESQETVTHANWPDNRRLRLRLPPNQPSQAPSYDAGSSGSANAISSAVLPPLPTATSRYCRPSWR